METLCETVTGFTACAATGRGQPETATAAPALLAAASH
jgi:hypothetical protein